MTLLWCDKQWRTRIHNFDWKTEQNWQENCLDLGPKTHNFELTVQIFKMGYSNEVLFSEECYEHHMLSLTSVILWKLKTYNKNHK